VGAFAIVLVLFLSKSSVWSWSNGASEKSRLQLDRKLIGTKVLISSNDVATALAVW